MQYQHAFHAGNFADVHKHITLLQLIAALQKKPKGFQYLDTHSGAGAYDLGASEARQGNESAEGIARLDAGAAGVALPAAIADYLDRVRAWRAAHGARGYPGSPLLALSALRDIDTAVCVESQAPVSRALQRAIDQAASPAPCRVVNADGYRELRAHLPPASRRGLVLIDPPYEDAAEERHIAAALAEGLARFATGVFAVWYPVKRRHDSDLWVARVTRGITRPTLAAEFCLNPPDHAAGLNGSGMLVVNPPWQFDVDAAAWQQALESLLGARGGSRVHWLVRESN